MMTSLSDAVVPVTSNGAAFSPSGRRWGMGLSTVVDNRNRVFVESAFIPSCVPTDAAIDTARVRVLPPSSSDTGTVMPFLDQQEKIGKRNNNNNNSLSQSPKHLSKT
jgi:hypothetical protein